tara:strand:+ start:162 stop:800 length:639 start_codon:yes stop_codon:yes gene_type:complete
MNYLLALAFVFSASAPKNTFSNDFVNPIKTTSVKTISYDEIHDQAIFNCPWAKRIDEDKEKIVSLLIDVEKQYDLPGALRGMLVAAACHESGYEIEAKGDYRNRRPMAIGLFQMWPWWEKAYKIKRTSPEQAAHAYMKHIKKMYKKVDRQCKPKTKVRHWLTAWATAIRAPKPGGRCGERPLFYRVLRKWHRAIKQERDNSSRFTNNGTDGC